MAADQRAAHDYIDHRSRWRLVSFGPWSRWRRSGTSALTTNVVVRDGFDADALLHACATAAEPGAHAMRSPQTLSLEDRRSVAAWAADCAERVLPLFEAQAPGDGRPRASIARTRAFARGELDVAEEIRRRFVGGGAAKSVEVPAAIAAARAAGQASAVAHMGAHALGAAAYAAKAAGLAAADLDRVVDGEVAWQLGHMPAAVQIALRQLPPVGTDRSGPLGPGLLASGLLGAIIRDLQAGVEDRHGHQSR